MRLDVDVDDRQALDFLDGIVERIEDDRSLVLVMGAELADYEASVFRTLGFGRWRPLAASTRRAKGSSRPLVDTGSLLRDLTRARNARMDGDSVVIETDHPAARPLAGGDRRRGVPARNPAPEPRASVVDDWADRLLRHLVDDR